MRMEDRLKLILRGLEEVIKKEEVEEKLRKSEPECYVGYEPSGRVHIGWLVWMLKLRDLQKAGIRIKVLEATIHAWINDKGNLEEIEEYKSNVRSLLNKLGISATYIDSLDMISDPEYVKLLLRSAKNTSLDRLRRSVIILRRRTEEVEQDFSKVLYPLMQAVDAIYLNVDFALGSIDQKPAFMMSRDLALRLGRRPVTILSTPLIPGLKAPLLEDVDAYDDVLAYAKMSSSRPDDAIFLDDDYETIRRKIMTCPCKPRETILNPILSIMKYIILPYYEKLSIDTHEGPVTIDVDNVEMLDTLYREGKIEPDMLKNVCAEYLTEMLDRIRG
ncbi:MAG: tyrosine--tRNA ligase [Crenarchaeota archaeon]|nr:tyrosine--tRNA ligase [Thermoproteota archaeon]